MEILKKLSDGSYLVIMQESELNPSQFTPPQLTLDPAIFQYANVNYNEALRYIARDKGINYFSTRWSYYFPDINGIPLLEFCEFYKLNKTRIRAHASRSEFGKLVTVMEKPQAH